VTEKTDVISLRVKESLKKQLEKAAKKDGVNPTTMITRILTLYFDWYRHERAMGWAALTRPLFGEIIKTLTKDEITKIAIGKGKEEFIGAIQFVYGELTLDNIDKFIEHWTESARMSYRHTEKNNTQRYILRHFLGINWSIFCATTVREAAIELGYKMQNEKIANNNVSFELVRN